MNFFGDRPCNFFWAELGSAAQPGSPLIVFGDHFMKEVNKASGGAIALEHQFVASEQENINQVIRGRLQSSQISYAGSGTFHEVSDADRQEWIKLMVPAQLDVVKEIGGRAQEIWDALQKGKAEFAAQRR